MPPKNSTSLSPGMAPFGHVAQHCPALVWVSLSFPDAGERERGGEDDKGNSLPFPVGFVCATGSVSVDGGY